MAYNQRALDDRNGADFFPTPRWATFALVENESFDDYIWECACGDGAMANVLAETGHCVMSSDFYDHGYGENGHDFTQTTRTAPNIVTNPPFNQAEKFVNKGLEAAQQKLALLLRLAFLEGSNRAATIYNKNPPSRVWVFSERITFYRKNAVIAGSGTMAFAWFVWDKSYKGPTELCWFKPGIKKRYTGSGSV